MLRYHLQNALQQVFIQLYFEKRSAEYDNRTKIYCLWVYCSLPKKAIFHQRKYRLSVLFMTLQWVNC